MTYRLLYLLMIAMTATACNKQVESKEEQISVGPASSESETDTVNSIQGNVSLNQIATHPNSVILTGIPNHRLVSVYKTKYKEYYKNEDNDPYNSYSSEEEEGAEEEGGRYMPGVDIMYGYNLLNIAHYDLQTEQLNFLFKKPALIKTLYYPSYLQDSLDNQPVNRNYYMISAYDEDTNKDTLINKWDLRRFYHFDISSSRRTQLIPSNYSVIRSQYDRKNDVMYIFAKLDKNKNGTGDSKEPIHIFWITLKDPQPAKRLY